PAVVAGAAEVLQHLRLQPGAALSHPHVRRPGSHHGWVAEEVTVFLAGGYRLATRVAGAGGAEVTASLAAGVTAASRTPEISHISEVAQVFEVTQAAAFAAPVTAVLIVIVVTEDAPAPPVVPIPLLLLFLL